MATRVDCESCRHYRATRPEPFSASDLRNPEVIEELTKWREHLNRREQKEAAQVDRGEHTFTHEPWFFAWCARHSEPAAEVLSPRDQRHGRYLLADVVNENGDCADFVARAGGRR